MVSLRPLNRFNWETASQLKLSESQAEYLPSNLFSIAQSKFEELKGFAIYSGEEMVGFLMYGNFSGVYWINRIMLDQSQQQKGLGRKAMQILLKKLVNQPGCKEIRTSFVRQNALAEYFFAQLSFERIADGLDEEIVMRYHP